MNTIDVAIVTNEIKRESVQVRKEIAAHKKHVATTLSILNTNIEYLKLLVKPFKNSDKYDYLYNMVANKYKFKMADDKSIDDFLAKHGIYRKVAFNAKKTNIFIAVHAIIMILSLVLAYYYNTNTIFIGLAVCFVLVFIFGQLRPSFLEKHCFSKISPDYTGKQ